MHFFCPLDEAYAECCLCLFPPVRASVGADVALEPYGTHAAGPRGREFVGTFRTRHTPVFWRAVARGMGASVALARWRGDNAHHVLESAFKAFARCFRKGLDRLGAAAPAERWAKFWEPTQRCFYFVSDASGESRWAAHFDDDVMVVETEDAVTYVHHATLEPVDGPAEATPNAEGTTAQDVCNWQTMIDPVSGQVYYYSRASGASRWTPPTWMDYYDPTEQCVYYVHRTSGESSWEEPAGFREEADAAEPDEAEDVGGVEEADAKETYEEAAVDDGAAKARVMFSYRKRPTAPWDPHGRTMRGTLKRQAASPGVVPSRKLQFGDTLVLGDIIAELD